MAYAGTRQGRRRQLVRSMACAVLLQQAAVSSALQMRLPLGGMRSGSSRTDAAICGVHRRWRHASVRACASGDGESAVEAQDDAGRPRLFTDKMPEGVGADTATLNPDAGVVEGTDFSVNTILKQLESIQQGTPKNIVVLGTRHCSLLHQQIIELLSYALVLSDNHIYTSGATGTHAAWEAAFEKVRNCVAGVHVAPTGMALSMWVAQPKVKRSFV